MSKRSITTSKAKSPHPVATWAILSNPITNYVETESAPNRYIATVIYLLLTAMVWIVYGQTLRHEFINYDDSAYVYENPAIIQGMTTNGIIQAFTHKELGLWNPLITISHMLDCQLYGLWPGGHHLTNVLLHWASVLLLFSVLKKMTGVLWQCAFVAALFAIHPLRVESVAWIAERKDVLSGLFFMLTLRAYLHYIKRPESWSQYLFVIFVFACGLMSKAMLVTLPFLLLVLDYWPLNRLFKPSMSTSSSIPWRDINWRVVAEKIPLILLSLGLCLAILTGGSTESNLNNIDPSDFKPISFEIRIGLAPVWLLIYLGQMFWPGGLAAVYPSPENYFHWWPMALSMWTLLSFIMFLSRKKHPYLWMGWLWNLGMLVPVLGILQISRHSQADHYNYLPQIGLYIAGVWALVTWIKAHHYYSTIMVGGSILILGALMFASYHQTSVWRDSTKLWSHTLSCTRDNYIAYNNLGSALSQQGKTPEAIVTFHKALEIAPAYAVAYNNLGLALFRQGKIQEAIAAYRRALEITPTYPGAYNNLGFALFQQGAAEEAIVIYRKALQTTPTYAGGHNNLGLALLQLGNTEEALLQFREAIQINPFYADFHNNLGLALFQKGNTEEAINAYRKALQINPVQVGSDNNLGLALLRQGKTDEAITAFRKALQIDSTNAATYNNLGACLYRKGQTEEAISNFRKAVLANPSYADATNNLGISLSQQGNSVEALVYMKKALKLQPDNMELQQNLAWALATSPQTSLRDGLWAIQLAKQANQSSGGNNIIILRTLAAAYAQNRQFPDAVQIVQKALRLAQTSENLSLIQDLNHELRLYKSNQPFPAVQ